MSPDHLPGIPPWADPFVVGAANPPPGDRSSSVGWRSPPREIRVAAVALVWALPGTLVGLMANLLCGLGFDQATTPDAAAALGAVLFAVAGGSTEAAD